MRLLISANLLSQKNIDGCLSGSVDDYLKDFEDIVEQLKQKLEREKLSLIAEDKQSQVSTDKLNAFIS